MSHIVSFRIEGLAGRKEPLKIELNRDTNIFFGLNGSGKTSLLKILHSAMSNETGILRTVPFTAAKVSFYSLEYDKVFTRSIKKLKPSGATHYVRVRAIYHDVSTREEAMSVEGRPTDEKWVWSCTPAEPKEASLASFAHEYLPTTRLHVTDEPFEPRLEYSRSGLTEEQLDKFFARSVEILWSSYSAQVLGAVRTAQEQGLASIFRAVLSTKSGKRKRRKSKLTPTMAYIRVQNFLKRQGSASMLGTQSDFEKRYNDDPTLQDVVHDINSVEDKIEKAMTLRNKLEELITRMYTGNKEIRFTDESIEVLTLSGRKIGLASLSSGEKQLLRIFIQTLLGGENTMLVDEPELSMHVVWQKDLIQSLRALNQKTQLIFATHSPEIMADVPDDKIFNI